MHGHRRAQFRCIAPLALAFGAAPAFALGLGDIVVSSRIGERLSAEVALTAGPGEEIAGSCFKLAPVLDEGDLPVLTGARIGLESSEGRPRLRITTRHSIDFPAFVIALRAGCGFELTRSYTVLLPFPDVQPRELPLAQPARIVPPVSTGLQNGGRTWRTGGGETLRSIGATLYPTSKQAQRNFIAAAARLNPELFDDARNLARHPISSGTSLLLPAAAEVENVTAPHAAAENDSQVKDSRIARSASTPERDRSARRGGPRLFVGPTREHALRMARSLEYQSRTATITEAERDALRREQRIVMRLDETILAEKEMRDKLSRLEEQVAALYNKETVRTETAPAANDAAETPTAVSAAEPAPRAAAGTIPAASADSPSPTGLSGALLGAVLLLACTLLFWLATRRRRLHERQRARSLSEMLEDELPKTIGAAVAPREPEPKHPMPPVAPFSEGFPGLEQEDIAVAEEYCTLTIAEIMLASGRVRGAVTALGEQIENAPRASLRTWIRLLEILRHENMQIEYERWAGRLHQQFNIAPPAWDAVRDPAQERNLEDFPHVMERITAAWGSQACRDYLERLLQDNRNGQRTGFSFSVLEDVLLLTEILDEIGVAAMPLPAAAPAKPSAGPVVVPLRVKVRAG